MTKSLLRDSLVDLMQTQDIRQISIKSICEHADVNRSTFYLYYGSQYDLLRDIEKQILADTGEILRTEHARHQGGPITASELTHLLELHLTHVSDNIRFFRTFSHSHEDFDLPLKTMHIILDPYVEQLAVQQGLDSATVHRMSVFLMFGCIGTVKDWIAHYGPSSLSPSELAHVMTGYIERVGGNARP